MAPLFLWLAIIIILALPGAAIARLVYWIRAQERHRRKMEAKAPVETPYGQFSFCWHDATSSEWKTDVEVGPSKYVSLSVPDMNGVPNPEQLQRIPHVLDVLPILLEKATVNTNWAKQVIEGNLYSIDLKIVEGDGEDLTLCFSDEESELGVFVDFTGDNHLGEQAID